MAEHNGMRAIDVQSEDKSWDFKSHFLFEAFGEVAFVEWTRYLPAQQEQSFITDVLDRYRLVAAQKPGEENTFKFYQNECLAASVKLDFVFPRRCTSLALCCDAPSHIHGLTQPLSGGPPRIVVEAPGIENVQCSRAPANVCVLSQQKLSQNTFSVFDPQRGNRRGRRRFS